MGTAANSMSKAFSSDPVGTILDPGSKNLGAVTDAMGLTDANNFYLQKTGPLGKLYESFIFSGGFGNAAGGEAAGAEGVDASTGLFSGESATSGAAGASEAGGASVAQAQSASTGSSAPAETLGSTPSEGATPAAEAPTEPAMPPATPETATSSSPAQTSSTAASTAKSLVDSIKTASTVLTPAASLLAAASGISASKKANAQPPKAPPPTVIPDSTGGKGPLSAPVVKRSEVRDQLARRGRASTILTSSGDKLGA